MARGSSAPPVKTESAASAAVDEQTKRRQAYNAAETRLKDEYKDRFRALVQEEAGKRGVTYEFRKTEEEKAREQYEALLAKYPNLRDQPVWSEDAAEQPEAEPAQG